VNYEDEDYVRLFTRDTPTWKSWRWEAKATIGPLMRKLDRNGRLDWPAGGDWCVYVAAAIDIPVKVVGIALKEFVRTDTITMGDGFLVMPNFVPGQNAARRTKSRAERTAEWKERVGYEHPPKTKRGDTVETRGDEVSPAETFSPLPLPSASPSPPRSIESSALSPQRPEDAGAAATGSNVLTHPTAEDAAGRVASQRRRAAVELWDWHEQERVRRLLAGTHHKPRCATDKFLGPVLRLHTHVRKAYDCTEAEAWQRIRDYREARLSETEAALQDSRPEASKWRSWAAGEAAWSHKGFDYLEQRGADPKVLKAQADADFAAEVEKRKRAARSGGSDA
jgi:hypothetical protein